MSEWNCEFRELPKRCRALLDKYFLKETKADPSFEVTLLLSLAAQALVVPLEKLDRGQADKKSIKWWKSIQSKKILKDSPELIEKCECREWYYATIAETENDELLGLSKERWVEVVRAHPLRKSNDLEVLQVMRHIRNAVSHAQVWSCGDPIAELMFISAKPSGCLSCRRKKKNSNSVKVSWRGLIIPVEDVKQLIANWCAKIEEIGATFDETPRIPDQRIALVEA